MTKREARRRAWSLAATAFEADVMGAAGYLHFEEMTPKEERQFTTAAHEIVATMRKYAGEAE